MGYEPHYSRRLTRVLHKLNKLLQRPIEAANASHLISLYQEMAILTTAPHEETLSVQLLGYVLASLMFTEAPALVPAHAASLTRHFTSSLNKLVFSLIKGKPVFTNKMLVFTRKCLFPLLEKVLREYSLLVTPSLPIQKAVELMKYIGKLTLHSLLAGVLELHSASPAFSAPLLIPHSDAPFLPQLARPVRTLLLDIDGTLGNLTVEGFVLRPGVHSFIDSLSSSYELGLFTAASAQYANKVLKLIDPLHRIQFVLHCAHTTTIDGFPRKDLSRLGRDLATTMLIDNCPQSFSLQPENGVLIPTWTGDPTDSALFTLQSSLTNSRT